ncbi:MAG TPA: DUF1499 domain-containing protein [Gemmatimonadota bacterium]|nr:DUF1499 domain-containing protein [Gemmatimonadota bacterium]
MSGISRVWLRARTNVARTDGTEPYPDLVPLELELPPNAAYVAALSAARAMPLWRVVSEDPGAGRIAAEATTPRMKFVDDVEIVVEPTGAGSRVRVRSASRVGKTDFGTNARRIRAFLARLATAAPA